MVSHVSPLDFQADPPEVFTMTQAKMLRLENAQLTRLLQEASSKLEAYKTGVSKIKRLIDTELHIVKRYLDRKQEPVDIFINRLINILDVKLNEVAALMNVSVIEEERGMLLKGREEEIPSAVAISNDSEERGALATPSERYKRNSPAKKIHESHDFERPSPEHPTCTESQSSPLVRADDYVNTVGVMFADLNCPICKRPFSVKRDLIRHIRIHTGEKPFNCVTCGKAFSRKDFLRKHMRVHTGIKPYLCTDCGKCFSQRSNLTKHMLIHLKRRKYICSICGQTFHQLINLKKHEETHKDYACKICFKQFQNKTTLFSHLEQHRQNDHTVAAFLPS